MSQQMSLVYGGMSVCDGKYFHANSLSSEMAIVFRFLVYIALFKSQMFSIQYPDF